MNRRQAAKAVENPVRWGLGDFVWVYIAGVFLGALLGSIGIAIGNENVDHPGAFGTGLGLLGQFGGWMLFAYVVARWKGRGSLRQDFGLRLDIADWWALFAGMGVFLVASAFIALPNSWITESQKVVEDLESATGAKLWIMAIFAAIVAPVCEELLFRGLLLRSLRRRMLPVWAIALQALLFALAHPLLSPTLGDLVPVPALFLLGALSGYFAETKGDLSRSILLHVGFNLITVVALVL